jgi:hypothetical protein
MNVFVISKVAFLLAVGVVSFAGSAILGWLFAKQPGRFRIGLWWLLAVILALSCAWANGGWPFPPRESQDWIGYVLLFAALLRSIRLQAVQLISALASVILGITVTLLPIAQVNWAPLTFGCWFFASLLSYLLVRLVLQKEFETASLRAPVLLLVAPLLVSAAMLFFAGSAMLAELAVAGAIAVGAAYVAHRSSALGRGLVEVILLFHFLLLLNSATYAHLPPAVAWLQWIVPALVIVLPETLQLQKRMTRRGQEIFTITGLAVAEAVVVSVFYFVVQPTAPFTASVPIAREFAIVGSLSRSLPRPSSSGWAAGCFTSYRSVIRSYPDVHCTSPKLACRAF